MQLVKATPRSGYSVFNPETDMLLLAVGEWVELNNYWRRRFLDKEVFIDGWIDGSDNPGSALDSKNYFGMRAYASISDLMLQTAAEYGEMAWVTDDTSDKNGYYRFDRNKQWVKLDEQNFGDLYDYLGRAEQAKTDAEMYAAAALENGGAASIAAEHAGTASNAASLSANAALGFATAANASSDAALGFASAANTAAQKAQSEVGKIEGFSTTAKSSAQTAKTAAQAAQTAAEAASNLLNEVENSKQFVADAVINIENTINDITAPKKVLSANVALKTGSYYTDGDVPTNEQYRVDVTETDTKIIQTATKGDGTVFTRAFEVGAAVFPAFAVKLASEYLLDGDKNQKQINHEQTSLNSKFSNRDVFVDDLFAGSGTLRPVSDLYNPSSPVYNPSFTDFASVKAVLTAATAPTDPLDWCAIQTCVNQFRAVHLAAKFYYVGNKSIELPTSCAKLIGRGDMTRIYSDAAIAIKAKDGVRIVHGEYGDFYLLGSNVANSIGFDASAFSYCTVKNIYTRQFGDGFFANGSITPVNKQYSNNIVMNVRSNNNLRDGFRFVGSSEANSANTYIGCEGAGNAGVGFNELIGYSNQTLGCTFQGNTTADLFTDGTRNIHQFYAEGNAKSIKFGSVSSFNKIDARTSYPIWNSFTDIGRNNSKSVRSDTKTEQHIFKNPYFEDWVSVNPSNVLPNGSPVLKWFSDANTAKGGGLQVTFDANFQGIIIQGLDPNINYAGQWVTVQIEADTSGVTDLSGARVYTRDGSTSNQTVGEFAAEALVKTEAGKYKSFTYDIRFPVAIVGTPTILFYLAYSGITTSNTIRILSTKVALGQRDRVGDYSLSVKSAASTADANFTDATSGLNTAWKTPGKLVYNTTRGKMYFAVASAAASAWRATDGSGDIVPA